MEHDVMKTKLLIEGFAFGLMSAACLLGSGGALAQTINCRVMVEEEVYRYAPAGNGAGPLWCRGSTCLVRWNDRVFASGLETLPNVKPLNNCRWLLFERKSEGWQLLMNGSPGRTREPCPLVVFQTGKLWLSDNPTLVEDPQAYAGPAQPKLFHFDLTAGEFSPQILLPQWRDQPRFTEHSYRSFAADGTREELILFQNIGDTHAEWAFRDATGQWFAGQLIWPFGAEYETPQPIRICYPCVALKDRQVYFFGISDIVEPNSAWREFKRRLTGRDWDYDFRRLFLTWCDDITKGAFQPWIEIASREKTCGWITPLDLWVSTENEVHLLWHERAIDERLRETFFPGEKQSYSLNYAVFKGGQVIRRSHLVSWEEGQAGPIPQFARFAILPGDRLMVFAYLTGRGDSGRSLSINRLIALDEEGRPVNSLDVPLKEPLRQFFTATPRAGCAPSRMLDLLGLGNNPYVIRYACLEIETE